MNSSLQRVLASLARGTVATGALALTAIVAPQMIFRAQTGTFNVALVYASLLFGLVGVVCAVVIVIWVGRLTPRRSSTRLAATYVGEGAGVLVTAARYLAYMILAVLGSALAVSGLEAITSLHGYASAVLAAFVILAAVPTLVGRPVSWRIILVGVAFGAAVLALVLVLGLVNELLGNGLSHGGTTVVPATTFDGLERHEIANSFAAALFPSAVLLLVSERSLARSGARRVSPRRLVQTIALVVVAISITAYFTVTLHMNAYAASVPTVTLAESFMGRPGVIAVGVAYICLGAAVAISAYWSMPRLIMELAREHLLPQYLASDDARKPRVISVGLTALCAVAVSTYFVDTQAGTMVFIFAVFVMVCLVCLTMALRGRSILKESVDKKERIEARTSQWGFALFLIAALFVTAMVAVANPSWAVIGTVALAVPAAFLLVMRHGRVRAIEKLAPTDITTGRKLPTRVHGVVLVNKLDIPTLRALSYARAARLTTLTAVTLDFEADATTALRSAWKDSAVPVNLTVLGTPEGASTAHIVDFVRSLRALRPADVVMVFVPRVIAISMWQRFFLRHSTPRIVSALRLETGVVVCEVPYQLAPNEAEDE